MNIHLMRSNPILLSGKMIFLTAIIFATTYMWTSFSPKLVSFFANCVPLKILSVPESMFLLLHNNFEAKSRNSDLWLRIETG